MATVGCPRADRSEAAPADGTSIAGADTPDAAAAAPPTEPTETRRLRARELLLSGRIPEGEALLETLWREGDDDASAGDGAILAASRARRDDLEGALDVLRDAEARPERQRWSVDIAAAIGTNLPRPGVAAAQLTSDSGFLTSAARASLAARLHERAGDVRGSIPFWELAHRRAPDEPAFLRELVRLYAATARNRDLEHALRRLVALQPTDLAAQVNLVRLLGRGGRREEAIAAAMLPPEIASGADREVHAGDVLLRALLPAEALARYDAALALDADRCEALVGRGRALLATGATADGRALLLDLVTAPRATGPCAVAAATRALLAENDPRMRRRLDRLDRSGKSADPDTLRAILGAGRPRE